MFFTKSQLDAVNLQKIYREVDLMKRLDHPHMVSYGNYIK